MVTSREDNTVKHDKTKVEKINKHYFIYALLFSCIRHLYNLMMMVITMMRMTMVTIIELNDEVNDNENNNNCNVINSSFQGEWMRQRRQ